MLSENTIRIAVELSASSWLVAVRLPGADKSRLCRIEGGDATALLALIGEVRSPLRVNDDETSPRRKFTLEGAGETPTWSCPARQPKSPLPPVALKTRKAVGRRWFQRHRRRRPSLWTVRVGARLPPPTSFAFSARLTGPPLGVPARSCGARGSIRRP